MDMRPDTQPIRVSPRAQDAPQHPLHAITIFNTRTRAIRRKTLENAGFPHEENARSAYRQRSVQGFSTPAR
jgi:hypothetical protein